MPKYNHFMKFSINSRQLFEGIDEIIANVVLEDGVHILKLKSTEKTNLYEVVGNTAVKADEPLLETQLLEGMIVRVNLEQSRQLIERYKEEAKKAWDRADMYKQKYEDSEYEKDCMREDYEEIIRAKDEEIIRLKAQLEYAEKHPQNMTVIQGPQYNNNSASDNRSQVAIQEMNVEAEGVGVQTSDTKDDIKEQETTCWCHYIIKGKAAEQYYKSDEEFYEEARLYITRKQAPDVVRYLQKQENLGVMCFYKSIYPDIFDQLVQDFGPLRFKKQSFVRNCAGWAVR